MREPRHNLHCHANSCEVRRLARFARIGFAMIELLVVCLLLIVLTTLYWSYLSPSEQNRKQKSCQQNLQKLHIALQIYATGSGGKFPVAVGARTAEEPLELLVPRYTVDTSLFICPASEDSPLPSGQDLRDGKISYAYYMGQHPTESREVLMSDRQIDTRPKAAGQEIFSPTGNPPGNNHQKAGGNILFCDGSVEFSPPRAAYSLSVTQGVVLLNPKP